MAARSKFVKTIVDFSKQELDVPFWCGLLVLSFGVMGFKYQRYKDTSPDVEKPYLQSYQVVRDTDVMPTKLGMYNEFDLAALKKSYK